MTKFFPMSAMLRSVALRPEQKLELVNAKLIGISAPTMKTVHALTGVMQGFDITMLYNEGTPLRRVYLQHPTQENWLALERNVFIDTGCGFGLNVDALH